MDNVVAMVFCGGEGTRLRPLSYLMRKEMLPIGRSRKPVLEFVVTHLRRNGIRDIVFLGSRASGGEVANYFGDGRQFGVRIRHQPDPKNCLGNGQALLWAIKELGLEKNELLIHYGDIISTTNLQELLDVHSSQRATATLAVSREYVVPKGVVTVDKKNGFVKTFEEKPHWKGSGEISIGLLCLNGESLIRACGGLPFTEDEVQKSEFRDVMGNIVTRLIMRHDRVAAYTTPAPWMDIGSFEDYAKVGENIEKLIGESEYTFFIDPAKAGLKVFISYHISEENSRLIEGLVIPSLNAVGVKTVSGGTLDRDHKVNKSPLDIAEWEIDQADEIISFATSDTADFSPSEYVKHEYGYARGKGKTVNLFVEKGTHVPDTMGKGSTYTTFERNKSGELIRDILQKVFKS